MDKSFVFITTTILLINFISIKAWGQVYPMAPYELNEALEDQIFHIKQKELFKITNVIANRTLSTESRQMLNQSITNEIDTDNDGLTDNEEIALGTDPNNRDTDGDGLWDGWEASGSVNGINLRSYGASPLHKDIFIQMDFMYRANCLNGIGPNDKVIHGIENVFNSSPVTNPDGKKGIFIHLIHGKEIGYQDKFPIDVKKFKLLKESNFDSNLSPIFHYMVWANKLSNANSSGHSFDTPGSEFVVALGSWNYGNGGTDSEKIGTFVHELGHNLGLRHGGNDDLTFKPNHVSVMNYFFQMSGFISNGKINYGYQLENIPALDELHLIETEGITNSSNFSNLDSTDFFTRNGTIRSAGLRSIDWNDDGIMESNEESIDLNRDKIKSLLPETSNEWQGLNFKGGPIGKQGSIESLLQFEIFKEKKATKEELTETLFLSKKMNK